MSLILNLVRTATLFSDGFVDWGADQDHRALVNLHRPVGNAPGPLEMKNRETWRSAAITLSTPPWETKSVFSLLA
nr:hypothetical protein Itr_chr06CG11210 [Ipomoea trifida]